MIGPTNRQEVVEGSSRFEVIVRRKETGEEMLRAECRGIIVSMAAAPGDGDPKFAGGNARVVAAGAHNRITDAILALEEWKPYAIERLSKMEITNDPD